MEVAQQQDVDAGEGACGTARVSLPLAGRGHDSAEPVVDLRQESCADHADLVDDEPAPAGEALGGVVTGVPLEARDADAEPAGTVKRAALEVRGIHALEGGDFVVEALFVAQQAE